SRGDPAPARPRARSLLAVPAPGVPHRPPVHAPRRRRPRGGGGAGPPGRVVSRRAVFMDRDGTLAHEVGYVNHVSRFRLFPWSVDAVRLLNRGGLLAVVVTNQAGGARRYFPGHLIGEVQGLTAGGVGRGGGALGGM